MSDNVGCVSTLNSQSVLCEVEKSSNRVKIVMAKPFADNVVNSNTFVDTATSLLITINNVHNPYSMKPSNPIQVQSRTSTDGIMS